MKLTSEQAMHVADQIGAQPVPDQHPNASQLKEALGDHTFFLSEQGLQVVETGQAPAPADRAAVVNVGSWSDQQEGALMLHEPQATPTVVNLDPDSSGGTAA